ncbi:P2Y purinoceptor 8 [Hypanus sabinus]|uniref:P2Y purinoceptor 8 n=1 Tax=Hypanus sabinus TaxID=79690 RepID=UPI0028C4557B|nr:P2Y purinoceptor 8 [Hypanus sabinus]XP_059819767.1 P2Y purinoceptor 8 [Hypanus sabinus]XP_059819768.1 P2Y purinoceptor 8 [Hypanus sabinus]XP_059819769.1 P2Y purinoceptor 8 [Hypanus sabinus]XP_059819770.1 P2Y purinoceptor 8 [Hypanus sabinus]XP_059819771.1 P2Y purinoceptor 8 [Hypanus sabinus]
MAAHGNKLDNDTLEMLSNPAIKNTLPIFYLIVAAISLPGNGFSLFLLCRTQPKTSSIVFMINLTITDLILGAFLPFQSMYHWKGNNWTFGSSLCSMVTVLFYANMYCSILTMTCISLERYSGVVLPMHCKRWRITKHAILICLVMWALVLITLLPLEMNDLTYEVQELNITTCFDVLKRDMLPSKAAWAAFLFTLFGILFLIPFCITVYCYIRIIAKLIKTSTSYGHKQKRRAICLALIVLLVFITCFTPNNFILLAHIIERIFYEKGIYSAYKITLTLSCLNSCLDPFIYYFASMEFRKKLRAFLHLRIISSQGSFTENRRESILSMRSTQYHANLEMQVSLRSTNGSV